MSDERQGGEEAEGVRPATPQRVLRDAHGIERAPDGTFTPEGARAVVSRRRMDAELVAYARTLREGAPPEKVKVLLDHVFTQAMTGHPLLQPRWAALYLKMAITPEVQAAMLKSKPNAEARPVRLAALSRAELEQLQALHRKATAAPGGAEDEEPEDAVVVESGPAEAQSTASGRAGGVVDSPGE